MKHTIAKCQVNCEIFFIGISRIDTIRLDIDTLVACCASFPIHVLRLL